MNNIKYTKDVGIIGGGPAGMTASIYVARANRTVGFIEKGAPGGLMLKTSKIENYSGFETINGGDLSLKMYQHTETAGAKFLYGEVVKLIHHSDQHQEVLLKNKEESLHFKKIIIASGTSYKVPPIDTIEKFNDKGVSYCAICDGPLYKNQVVGVIGGGNSAIEESKYLSSIAKEVHIFVRKDHLRAEKSLIDDLNSVDNVTIHFESQIKEFKGDEKLESIIYTTKDEEHEMKISLVCPYIGLISKTDFLEGLGITNEHGFVITNEHMETKLKGIYAVGDVREKEIRQISTATGDGTIAGKIVINALK